MNQLPPEQCANQALEAAFGIRFRDQALLRAALTHRSYLNESADSEAADNERLEFLGDAFLDFVAGAYLFRCLPKAREGELTALRAALVCEAATARYARRIGLGAYLRLGKGEEAAGGRERSAMLGDAFEALVGAILVDAGVATARRFVLRFLAPELRAVLAGKRGRDSRSRFQEIAQQRWQRTPRYVTVAESGPDHAKRFRVEVFVGERSFGAGEGPSKVAAARRAAEAALRRMQTEDSLALDSPPARSLDET